ncbi:hypothetical protein EON71_00040 [bacterium]|nr:MAG: hypothetical protein EON71_00040 [bacterium]
MDPHKIDMDYLAKRMWNFSLVENENLTIKDMTWCMMFPLGKKHMRPGATAFNQFNSVVASSETQKRIFQMLMAAAYKTAEQCDKSCSNEEKFIRVVLEPVFATSQIDTGMKKVVEHRFWIFGKDNANIGYHLQEIIEANEKCLKENCGDNVSLKTKERQEEEAKNSKETKIIMKKGKKAHEKILSRKEWADKYLKPHQKYFLIDGISDWISTYCNFYTTNRDLDIHIQSIKNGRMSLGDNENPATPKKVFIPLMHFKRYMPETKYWEKYPDGRCDAFIPVIEEQSDYEYYRSFNPETGAIEWCIPAIEGETNHAIEITKEDMNPEILFYKYFPMYQKSSDIDLSEEAYIRFPSLAEDWKNVEKNFMTDTNTIEERRRNDEEDDKKINEELTRLSLPQVADAKKREYFNLDLILKNFDDKNIDIYKKLHLLTDDSSDFKKCLSLNLRLKQRLGDIPMDDVGRVTYKEKYDKYLTTSFENFTRYCWNEDAMVSETFHLVRNFLKDPFINGEQPSYKFDPAITQYSNWLVKQYHALSYAFNVAHLHNLIIKLIYGVKDAYRVCSGLRYNALFAGGSAIGKSFIMRLVASIFITGTVTFVTNKTANADSVDHDQTDGIEMAEEMPSEIGFIQKDGRGSQTAAEKEVLTSGLKTKYICEIDEATGRRTRRMVRSEVSKSTVYATNESENLIDPAFASRFDLHQVGNLTNDERTSALMEQDYSNNTKRQNLAKDWIRRYRIDQSMCFLVEKMIGLGILPPINEKFAVETFFLVHKIMKKKNIDVSNRTIDRMRMIARQKSISFHLDCIFNSPNGKYFNKKFDITQLLEFRFYAYIPEDVVFDVICQFSDQIFNIMEYKVFKILNGKHQCSSSWARKDTNGYSSSIRNRSNTTDYPNGTDFNSTINNNIDYNYAKFKAGNFSTFIHSLSSDSGKYLKETISYEQISNVLLKLKSKSISSQSYIQDDVTGREKIDDDSLPSSFESIKLVYESSTSLHILVHSALLETSKPIELRVTELINELCYDKTIKRNIVVGFTVNEKYPTPKYIEINPTTEKRVKCNYAAMTEDHQKMLYNHILEDNEEDEGIQKSPQENSAIVWDLDYDTLSIRDHYSKNCYDLGSLENEGNNIHPAGLDVKANEIFTNGLHRAKSVDYKSTHMLIPGVSYYRNVISSGNNDTSQFNATNQFDPSIRDRGRPVLPENIYVNRYISPDTSDKDSSEDTQGDSSHNNDDNDNQNGNNNDEGDNSDNHNNDINRRSNYNNNSNNNNRRLNHNNNNNRRSSHNNNNNHNGRHSDNTSDGNNNNSNTYNTSNTNTDNILNNNYNFNHNNTNTTTTGYSVMLNNVNNGPNVSNTDNNGNNVHNNGTSRNQNTQITKTLSSSYDDDNTNLNQEQNELLRANEEQNLSKVTATTRVEKEVDDSDSIDDANTPNENDDTCMDDLIDETVESDKFLRYKETNNSDVSNNDIDMFDIDETENESTIAMVDGVNTANKSQKNVLQKSIIDVSAESSPEANIAELDTSKKNTSKKLKKPYPKISITKKQTQPSSEKKSETPGIRGSITTRSKNNIVKPTNHLILTTFTEISDDLSNEDEAVEHDQNESDFGLEAGEDSAEEETHVVSKRDNVLDNKHNTVDLETEMNDESDEEDEDFKSDDSLEDCLQKYDDLSDDDLEESEKNFNSSSNENNSSQNDSSDDIYSSDVSSDHRGVKRHMEISETHNPTHKKYKRTLERSQILNSIRTKHTLPTKKSIDGYKNNLELSAKKPKGFKRLSKKP